MHFLINEQMNEWTHRTDDDPLELCEIVNKWSTEEIKHNPPQHLKLNVDAGEVFAYARSFA